MKMKTKWKDNKKKEKTYLILVKKELKKDLKEKRQKEGLEKHKNEDKNKKIIKNEKTYLILVEKEPKKDLKEKR